MKGTPVSPHALLVSSTAVVGACVLAACGSGNTQAPTADSATTSAAAAPAAMPVPQAASAASAAVPVRLKANGYSPAWVAEVEGERMQLSVPAHADPDGKLRPVTVVRTDSTDGTAYQGQDGAVSVTLELNSGPCVRTGEPREFVATLRYGGETMHGCADSVGSAP